MILYLHEQGLSDKNIGQQVGKQQRCISRFLRGYRAPAYTTGKRERPARRVLTARDEHVVKRLILSGECRSAMEIARQAPNLGLPQVSHMTVRRALRRQGLAARVTPRKPSLTKLHMQRRLTWAREHRDWTVDDWRRVIFSDESKVQLVSGAGRSWCWRGTGRCTWDRRTIKPTKKFGGGSIMVWGCMSAKGPGNMCRILVNMTGPVYAEILQRHMLRSRAWLLPHPAAGFVLQQDNDPKHTSRAARGWLEDHHVATLSWPAQSPDLTPIEHIWATLKNRVRAGPSMGTVEELWERLEHAWWAIEPSLCERLVATMPARIKAVIRAHGGYTRY